MITKKNYSITDDENVIIVDKQKVQGLQRIYNSFFYQRNCTQLFNILNKFSRIDAVLTSGNTQIVIEYKNRKGKSVAEFDSVILEQEKYIKIIEAQKLLDSPIAFYVMEFIDCVVVFTLSTNEYEYKWEIRQLQSQMHNGYLVDKSVTYLPYNQATYIIGKKKWQQATIDQLNEYIRRKQNEFV